MKLRHRTRVPRGVQVTGRPRLGRRLRLEVDPGGALVLHDGCALGDGTWILVRGGRVAIGPGARLGDACRLVAHAGIEIGAGAVLGDEVAVVDVDHEVADVERPVREQPLLSAPVLIGERAVVEPGAALLRGVTVGAGARVGARAVVTRDVPAGAVVAGVPARAAAGGHEPPPPPPSTLRRGRRY